MIASRTIQHNGDRTYEITFILLSYNGENDQKLGFRDLKCRNEAQNWNLREKLSKTSPVEKFWLWSKSQRKRQRLTVVVNSQSQLLACANVGGWRRCWRMQDDVNLGLTWKDADGLWRVVHVEHVCTSGGAWSACSIVKRFRQLVWVRVRFFLAVLGWVLLGIRCSVTLCLCFGSWMNIMMRSKSRRNYGRDSDDSLLTMNTGWRRGQ